MTQSEKMVTKNKEMNTDYNLFPQQKVTYFSNYQPKPDNAVIRY